MRINSGRISQNVSTVKKSDFSKKQPPGVFYKRRSFFKISQISQENIVSLKAQCFLKNLLSWKLILQTIIRYFKETYLE